MFGRKSAERGFPKHEEIVLHKVMEQVEKVLRQIRGNRAAMIFQEPLTSLNPLHTLERQIGEVLQKEVPPLIETLNVARMVEEKVNRLDILKVEGLLMGIMKEQFKYINLFGALLGFLIGLINLLVLHFRPY